MSQRTAPDHVNVILTAGCMTAVDDVNVDETVTLEDELELWTDWNSPLSRGLCSWTVVLVGVDIELPPANRLAAAATSK